MRLNFIQLLILILFVFLFFTDIKKLKLMFLNNVKKIFKNIKKKL